MESPTACFGGVLTNDQRRRIEAAVRNAEKLKSLGNQENLAIITDSIIDMDNAKLAAVLDDVDAVVSCQQFDECTSRYRRERFPCRRVEKVSLQCSVRVKIIYSGTSVTGRPSNISASARNVMNSYMEGMTFTSIVVVARN